MVIHHTLCFTFLLVQFVLSRGSKDTGGHGTGSSQGEGSTSGASPTSTVAAAPSVMQSSILVPSTSPPPTSISSPSAQPTTAPSNSSIAAPPMTFVQLSNATTCTPMMLSWQPISLNATDSHEGMQLVVTNINVTQSAPSNSSSSDTPPALASLSIQEIISNHTAMSSGTFNWTAVSVPEGWYIVIARPEYPMQLPVGSAKFFVTTGSNTSCIDSSFLKGSSTLSAGALAGTVVGSIVGVIAVLGAFIIPRLWRRGVPGHKAWMDRRGKLFDVF
ncbi:hypothetical protein BU17DRAFT_89164 [Hysterangium stoloniferum]|nr:hypothetical protein BU17DRAFT_89164 [Hysterangium stoloniferum]